MKRIFQVLFFFLAATIVILLIGGSADFLAAITSNELTRMLGLEEGSFLTIILLVLVFMTAVMLLVPVALLVRTRFVKPVVFISFKHIHEKKATELEAQLIKEGFGVERLAFSKSYKHDEVVSQVRTKLQKSHVLVAIPDAEEASFVDAELLAASTLKIPIVLLKYQENKHSPVHSCSATRSLISIASKQKDSSPCSDFYFLPHGTGMTSSIKLVASGGKCSTQLP